METNVKKSEILAIVGPTASGKSALAVEMAKCFDGEIISCDSMQVYRGMNIGTAKPTPAEMRVIPHHMIDVADPTDSFSSADYAAMARVCVDDVTSRGKLPIVCGGTGLYLDALLRGDCDRGGGADEEYRRALERTAEEEGSLAVYRMLEAVDPESAAEIHPNNIKRVIRALEVFHTTGMKKSEADRLSKLNEPAYETLIIGIKYLDRKRLYDRIDKRVDKMLDDGLCDEIRELERLCVFRKSKTASQAIGYKELLGYIDGRAEYGECVEELKRATRRYAKRQITWFSRYDNIKWIYPDEFEGKTFKDIVNNAKKLFSAFSKRDIISGDEC